MHHTIDDNLISSEDPSAYAHIATWIDVLLSMIFFLSSMILSGMGCDP